MSTVSLITPESMANCFRSCVKTANEHARKKVSAANKVLFSSEETESQRDTLIFNFKAHRFNFLNLATLVTVSLIALNPYIGIALTAVALFARAVYNKAADPRTALSDQSKKTHQVWGPTEVRLGSLVLYKYNLATRFRDDLERLDGLHNLDAQFATIGEEPDEPLADFKEAPLPGSSGAGTKLRPKGE